MAQILTQLKNPWGAQAAPGSSGLDAQRSDLFTLDLSQAIRGIITILQRVIDNGADPSGQAGNLLSSLPTTEQAPFLANAVDFPEIRTGVSIARRHEIALNYPGYDEAVGQVNVRFTQDSTMGESGASCSQVVALLRAWRAIVRAGRGGQDSYELAIPLNLAGRNPGYMIPHFRHDAWVYLWRGRSSDVPGGAYLLGGTPANAGLELSGAWTIRRMWLAGFQAPSLQHANSGIAEVRATFMCDTIVETSPGVS